MSKKDSREVAIEVKNLSKSFRLPTEKSSSIKQAFVNWVRGVKGYKEQKVLRDISFNVEKGDFFGIVGRNGSGKSTLLKLISGIYEANGGSIKINGSLVSFIELGVGFNSELTGRENVYLNGALLGFSVKEIDAMYDEIVEFAELKEFMDQKLKNYSSGMQVRLAFSCAIRAKSDILVLDEVLAVGDEAFQRKCNNYFEKMSRDDQQTVILVTHSMEAVNRYCNKAIFIKDGKIVKQGSPSVVADEYSRENLESHNDKNQAKKPKNDNEPTISARIIDSPVLNNTDRLTMQVEYQNTDDRPVYVKIVINYRGIPVMAANSKLTHKLVTSDTKKHVLNYELPLTAFNRGDCSVVALLVDSEEEVNLAEFGYGGELVFDVKNPVLGTKIGALFQDAGEMRLIK